MERKYAMNIGGRFKVVHLLDTPDRALCGRTIEEDAIRARANSSRYFGVRSALCVWCEDDAQERSRSLHAAAVAVRGRADSLQRTVTIAGLLAANPKHLQAQRESFALWLEYGQLQREARSYWTADR